MKLFTKSFLLAVALLVIAEATTRTFGSRSMSGRFEYGYNPTSGFNEQKDGTVKLVRAGGRRFHPQSFKIPKPQGVLRGFVIGDSVPRGPSLKESYAKQLEKMLNEKGVHAEVLNLAVPGYGSRRNQIVLTQALKYQPDFIIVHLHNSTEYEDAREYQRAQEFKSWHPKNWLMKSYFLRRLYEFQTESVFWKFLPEQIREQTGAMYSGDKTTALQNKEIFARWQKQVEDNAHEDLHILKNANVQGIFVVQAVVHDDAQGRPFLDDEELDALGKSLEQEGAKVVYMKEIFSATPDFKREFADGSHLMPSGHRRIAEALVPLLPH